MNIKEFAKDLLPRRTHHYIRSAIIQCIHNSKYSKAKVVLLGSPTGNFSFLGMDYLIGYQKKYGLLKDYFYDKNSVKLRGIARARDLIGMQAKSPVHDFLELGCWDGMVSAALADAGKSVTAIDRRDTGFDVRARAAGVAFFAMNASALEFPDASFDFIFSYDAFEHFENPEGAFAEMIRVLRPGGHLYLDFGPIYNSPFGEHAYQSISVPYCQFLFSEETINSFARNQGLAAIDFSHVNRRSLRDYRALWEKWSGVLQRVEYYESIDFRHLNLIIDHPGLFNRHFQTLDEFTVDNIRVLFRKSPVAHS
jgi:SAM-dependent methyltransferase